MTKSGKFTIEKPFLLAGLILFFMTLIIIYLYRDDIFQTIQDPRQPFQTYEKPAAPDYTSGEAWLAQPELTQDPFEHPSAGGDVFVVVPSVYRGGKHWVLPSDDLKRKNKLQRIVRPNYVAPYGSAGRLFAPYYRQASLYSFMTQREDARKAQDFAYQDVKRAFEVFLESSPPERPIILVGHNQGASHVQRLLGDFFQGPLKKRLAAAYVIDHPLPLDSFQSTLAAQKPCETSDDTGCIVAFGAFMPGDDVIARRFVSRLTTYAKDDYVSVEGRKLLCTNPLLWNTSEDYAPARLHLGGIAAEGIDPDMSPAPLQKQGGAQCEDGILYVDKPKSKSLRRPFKVGGKFRTLPSNFFYEDLRVNSTKRVQALIASGTLPKRAAKLEGFDLIEIQDSPVTPIKD